MNSLRIVFMGTPDFAVGILDKLIQHKYNIVGVVTAPDRPAGRGQKLQESAVKKYALTKNLKILQPPNLKSESFLEELKSLQANLQIIVAFRMLPKVVWKIPAFGTFNLHASLLPDYRGAAPINWAIMKGEKYTGATTFFIDDKIDTGEIIAQSKIPIKEDDTAGTLHDTLMNLGADLVLQTVQQIEAGKVTTKKQPNTPIEKVAYKIHKETCEINWDKPIGEIYNHIRGLSPYPASWTTLYTNDQALFLKIYKVAVHKEIHDHKVKTVIFDKKSIKVAVQDGFIELLEIQLPGKRKMRTQDVLNGFSLGENAKVG
ncbi:methionyl-tRNA formyltransferase [Cellulophaga sp. Hel_I_12]|uniref:methionyl-tRNA formyltransferase n=1 Tax=Cellulophaga sp. Hel_I_12 TaxID=1249972 RepID=UPI0006469074|nr:methionyl-tRNA formyltransferase [Cellulophaga sp. Hel_I_12]